ncbi:uncharacterized protein LOC132628821 [Lycium barbarum]|uniref:uncharacterized protein LOC132628821 n=1 Tax=Lycium barbarum TaxID=112863 RepID=UPI00293EE32A|nr:uncharacterized protein LOC132628821 [Lycium barbarum]
MEKFYEGLDPVRQSLANNAADGCFMNKSYRRVTHTLDRLTTYNQAWHSNNDDIMPYGSVMIQNMVKENQDTQQTLAELATNISLLTKKLDDTQIKKVNVCEDDSVMPKGMYQVQDGPFHKGPPMQVEDANYVNNPKGGYQRQNYHGSYQNQNQWRPQQGQGAYNNNNNNSGSYNNNYGEHGSSRDEAMLEKVLENQSKFERTLSGLAKTVGSHTTAIQKLESQIRDISREKHPPKKGGLLSDTIPNPKNGGGGAADIPEISKEADDKSKQALKQLSLNFPFLEAVKEMPSFAKYLKDLLTKKKIVQDEAVILTHTVSSIISTTTVQKNGDPGAFTIPCSIGHHDFSCALSDNGASINLMPLAIYKQSGLGIQGQLL